MALEILATTQITVSATAVLILASNAARREGQVYNPGPNTIYVGQASTTTATTGYAIPTGFPFQVNPYKGDLYAIGAAGTNQVATVLETN